MVGTSGYIDCQGNLVGDFLANNIVVMELQHRLCILCLASFASLFDFAVVLCVETSRGFLLTGLGEVGHPLHIADDTGEVVQILAVAVRALLEVALVYVTAVVADGVRNIEGEIVAAFVRSNLQKLLVLLLAQVLLKVHVEC